MKNTILPILTKNNHNIIEVVIDKILKETIQEVEEERIIAQAYKKMEEIQEECKESKTRIKELIKECDNLKDKFEKLMTRLTFQREQLFQKEF